MRFIILLIFSTITITASAQFWKKKKPVPPVRYELLNDASADFLVSIVEVKPVMPGVDNLLLKLSKHEIISAEDAALKAAKHNMRFRIYNEASYNFSNLSELYMMQNRFSEAKWYLLQSNAISRQLNDDHHTISNLLDLATLKLAIGEQALAKLDLQEAHDLAKLKGFTNDVTTIEKRIQEIQFNKSSSAKAELRYAEAVEPPAKSQ
jgi:hypothetical protein